jgi:hypothetical protein
MVKSGIYNAASWIIKEKVINLSTLDLSFI